MTFTSRQIKKMFHIQKYYTVAFINVHHCKVKFKMHTDVNIYPSSPKQTGDF